MPNAEDDPISRIVASLGRVAVVAAALVAAASLAARAEPNCGQRFSCAELVYLGLTYPYARPDGSYLFIDGTTYPYVQATDRLLGDSTVRLPDGSVLAVSDLLRQLGLADHIDQKLTPVIGYGSNPSPAQLSRKYDRSVFKGTIVIPVMKGEVADYDVVWTPVFVSYGAMPSTITPSPGTNVDMWITWLTPKEAERMNDSEGAGNLYALDRLEGVAFHFDGPQPAALNVFVACVGALTIDGKPLAVAAVPARGREFPAADSAGALKAIAPHIGWTGSVFDLVYLNVTNPVKRAGFNEMLKSLGVLAKEPDGSGAQACGTSKLVGGQF